MGLKDLCASLPYNRKCNTRARKRPKKVSQSENATFAHLVLVSPQILHQNNNNYGYVV